MLVYARTARGFKGGGQNIRGAGSAESFLPFRPEIVTDYEVGVKSDLFNRRVRINVAAFYSDYKNIQRTILLPTASGGNASLITNAAKARIQGIEGDLTVVPVEGLTLSASGAVTDTKYKSFVDVTGDRTNEDFLFPKYTFALGTSYSLPVSFGAARASVNYNWSSKRNLGPTTKYIGVLEQKAYGLLDARLSFTIESIDADVAVFGKNLTQRHYSTAGIPFDNSLGYNVAYSGVPRTFGLEITKRFGGE